MVIAVDEIARGREAYARGAWPEAFEALSEADRAAGLEPEDLDRLATAAYMLARQDDHRSALERLHRMHLDAGRTLPATRAAYWLGMHLFNDGEVGQATGWIGRAHRLVARVQEDCVERGYLLMPVMFQRQAAGDRAGAIEAVSAAAEYAERFGDADLLALAEQAHGRMLMDAGRIEEGRRLLDEAMVSVTSGELSPIVRGIVYCGVILACQKAFDHGRAKEWTAALSRWCDEQSDMVAFTGRCMVHRAEIFQREGAWGQALEEARTAQGRCIAAGNVRAAGEAAYLQGELRRLQGDAAGAEEAYRQASRLGCEPQPGLALLRAAQGDTQAAMTAIHRALAATTERTDRAALLPACVEIMLLGDAVEQAEEACVEFEGIAAGHGSALLDAMAAQARGALELVRGRPGASLPRLRRAVELWQELGAPYEAARARVLIGMACRELGDDEAALLEIDAARDVLQQLGAGELDRVQLPGAAAAPVPSGSDLTPRELEVLRLVAAGRTNKEIAAELVLSERTVHRHLSNVYAKLRVSSRTAATAYAYEHALL